MIRLIALDFDYTLIDYQDGQKPRIEPEALALLNRLCERGVKAGIVTGRVFDGFAATLADVGGDWRAPSDSSARIWLDEIAREVPEAWPR